MQIKHSLTGASLRNCDTFIGWNIIKHQNDTYEDHTKTAISYDKTLNIKRLRHKIEKTGNSLGTGNSLAVQWLAPPTSTTKGTGSISSPHALVKPKEQTD